MAEIVAIETSVLVRWYLDEDDSESAILLRDKTRGCGSSTRGPDTDIYETLNTLGTRA